MAAPVLLLATVAALLSLSCGNGAGLYLHLDTTQQHRWLHHHTFGTAGLVFATAAPQGPFQPLCADHWTMAEAEVVCKELGLWAAVDVFALPLQASDETAIGPIRCTGEESAIDQCWSFVTPSTCLLAAGVVCGQPPLQSPIIDRFTAREASQVYNVDLDHDEDEDIVVAVSDGSVIAYENVDGRGTFSRGRTIGVFTNPARRAWHTVVAFGDLDGDGTTDLTAAIGGDDGAIVWVRNTDGRGSFEQAPTVLISVASFHVDMVGTGDVDGDGKLDVVASVQQTDAMHRLIFFRNLGAGSFAPGVDVRPPKETLLGSTNYFLVANLDGVGSRKHIVETSPGLKTEQRGLLLHEIQPDGTFVNSPMDSSSTVQWHQMGMIVDVEVIGDPSQKDLVWFSQFTGKIRLIQDAVTEAVNEVPAVKEIPEGQPRDGLWYPDQPGSNGAIICSLAGSPPGVLKFPLSAAGAVEDAVYLEQTRATPDIVMAKLDGDDQLDLAVIDGSAAYVLSNHGSVFGPSALKKFEGMDMGSFPGLFDTAKWVHVHLTTHATCSDSLFVAAHDSFFWFRDPVAPTTTSATLSLTLAGFVEVADAVFVDDATSGTVSGFVAKSPTDDGTTTICLVRAQCTPSRQLSLVHCSQAVSAEDAIAGVVTTGTHVIHWYRQVTDGVDYTYFDFYLATSTSPLETVDTQQRIRGKVTAASFQQSTGCLFAATSSLFRFCGSAVFNLENAQPASVLLSRLATAVNTINHQHLDHDQLEDLVLGFQGKGVAWFRSTPFGLASPRPISSSGTSLVSFGDLNGDSFVDVVATGVSSDHGVVWYINPGERSSDAWTGVELDYSPLQFNYRIAVRDIDGDGDLDVGPVFRQGLPFWLASAQAFGRCDASAVGVITGCAQHLCPIDSSVPSQCLRCEQGFALSDATTCTKCKSLPRCQSTVCTRAGTFCGQCEPPFSAINGSCALEIFPSNKDFATFVSQAIEQPGPIASGDADLDGDLDLIVASLATRNVYLLLNEDSGTKWVAAREFVLTRVPQVLFLEDINADGAPDVLVCGGNAILGFFGDSSNLGTFSDTETLVVTGISQARSALTIRNEGTNAFEGFVVGEYAVGNVQVVPNGATYPLTGSDVLTGKFGINSVSLSADGIATVGYDISEVWWIERTQSGFGAAELISNAPKNPIDATILTIDGLTVVAVVAFNDDKVRLFSKKDGAWEETILPVVLDAPVSITACDLDGDGYEGLLVSSFHDDRIVWLAGTERGMAGFLEEPAHIISTNIPSPEFVHVADLDNDNDIDIVVSSKENNEVGIFTNTRFDLDPPVTFCQQTLIVSLDPTQSVAEVVPDTSVTDNTLVETTWYEVTGGDSSVQVVQTPPLLLPPGNFTNVTFVAEDSHGNRDSCSFGVVVRDEIKPTISQCHPGRLLLTAPSSSLPASVTLDPALVLATDNVAVDGVVFHAVGQAPPALTATSATAPTTWSITQHGAGSVLATARDTSGNAATCEFGVTALELAFQGTIIAFQGSYLTFELLKTANAANITARVIDNLPAGLTAQQHLIVGTPVAATDGSVAAVVELCHAGVGEPACSQLTLSVEILPFEVGLTPGSAPSGKLPKVYLDHDFSLILAVDQQGGAGCLEFFMADNTSLPAGLKLSTSGVLSGRPEASGVYTLPMVVRDSAGIETAITSASGSSPTLEVVDCGPNSCGSGGQCKDGPDTHDGEFTCLCAPGLSGPVCALPAPSSSDQVSGTVVSVAAALGGLLIILLLVGFVVLRRARREAQRQKDELQQLHRRVNSRFQRDFHCGDAEAQHFDSLKLKRSEFTVGEVIASGEFGTVHHGMLHRENSKAPQSKVAIKMLKKTARTEDQENLLLEARLMAVLSDHQNVVQILGCCFDDAPFVVVMEFVPDGDLLTYLRIVDQQSLTDQQLALALSQLASAMDHVAKRGIVHRDLAARNVLVAEGFHLKLADFGLSRRTNSGTDTDEKGQYYKKLTDGRVPVKWLAPESFGQQRRYSTKSDVWSFGILCYEVYTFGLMPYKNLTALESAVAVATGYRLPRPNRASKRVYVLMRSCWRANPRDRPSFSELQARLADSASRAATDTDEPCDIDESRWAEKTLTLGEGLDRQSVKKQASMNGASTNRDYLMENVGLDQQNGASGYLVEDMGLRCETAYLEPVPLAQQQQQQQPPTYEEPVPLQSSDYDFDSAASAAVSRPVAYDLAASDTAAGASSVAYDLAASGSSSDYVQPPAAYDLAVPGAADGYVELDGPAAKALRDAADEDDGYLGFDTTGL